MNQLEQAQPTSDDRTHSMNEILENMIKINERLKVLATLEGGYKIWVNQDDSFIIDNSYIPSLNRWLYSQSRDKTIRIIIDDAKYIKKYFNSLEDKSQKVLKTNVNGSLVGLSNMKQAYTEHAEKLDTVIAVLRHFI